jgi:hypothetical protein
MHCHSFSILLCNLRLRYIALQLFVWCAGTSHFSCLYDVQVHRTSAFCMMCRYIALQLFVRCAGTSHQLFVRCAGTSICPYLIPVCDFRLLPRHNWGLRLSVLVCSVDWYRSVLHNIPEVRRPQFLLFVRRQHRTLSKWSIHILNCLCCTFVGIVKFI